MNKTTHLLSASAIALSVGLAGSLAATPAKAVDITDNISLDFIYETAYGFVDASEATQGNNAVDSDILTDGEVHFGASFDTDDGYTIGAKVELGSAQSSTNNADELYAYVSGGFGRVEVGDQDGAADKLAWEVPNVGYGQLEGDYSDFAGPGANVAISESGDDTKVTYYTPSFNGVKLGASFAPADDEGSNIVTTQGEEENQIELGLSIDQSINDVDVEIGLVYFQDNQEDRAEDFGAWAAGINFSIQDFTFGIGHMDNGDGGATTAGDDVAGTAAGVTYGMGAWEFGLSYVTNENRALTAQDSEVYATGFNYEWKPKVKGNTPVTVNFSGDIVRFDSDASNNGATAADSGTIGILFTSVEF